MSEKSVKEIVYQSIVDLTNTYGLANREMVVQATGFKAPLVDEAVKQLRARQAQMHTASQALAIERQASAQPSLAERVSRPKTRAILGLMRLNFLSVMVKYRAHIKAGFTETQALELCKS